MRHDASAARAAQLGLITAVVPDQELLTTARETAKKLAAKPAQSLQACKRLIRGALREQLVTSITLENENFAARLASAEAKDALGAVLGKRAHASR